MNFETLIKNSDAGITIDEKLEYIEEAVSKSGDLDDLRDNYFSNFNGMGNCTIERFDELAQLGTSWGLTAYTRPELATKIIEDTKEKNAVSGERLEIFYNKLREDEGYLKTAEDIFNIFNLDLASYHKKELGD